MSARVVLVQPVPIDPQDTLETLEARVHAVEHEIYVKSIAQVLRELLI